MIAVNKVSSLLLLLLWSVVLQASEVTDNVTEELHTTQEAVASTAVPRKPSAPGSLIGNVQNNKSISLSWTEPVEWNGDPVGYDLWLTTQDGHQVFSIRLKGQYNKNFQVTDLKPETYYTVHLRSVIKVNNEEVESETVELTIQTTVVKTPSPPRDLTSSGQKYTSVSLSWNEPSEWNGEPVGYDLWIHKENDTVVSSIRLKGRNNRQFKATDLSSGTNYTVELRAVSLVNEEEVISEPVLLDIHSTDVHSPSQVKNLRVLIQTTGEVTIAWDQPEDWGGPPEGYQITITSPTSVTTVFVQGKDKTQYTFPTEKDVNYGAYVSPFITDNGQRVIGQTSSIDIRAYSRRAPSPPRNPRAVYENAGSLVLVWDEPVDWNGDVGGYVISYTDDNGVGVNVKLTGEDITRFSPSGLKPDTHYIFNIIAFNIVSGQQTSGQPVVLDARTFSPERPGKPTNLKVVSTNSTSFTVRWDKMTVDRADSYEVIHVVANKEIKEVVNENRITLFDLQPWTSYYISVSARKNVNNKTAYSEPALITVQTNYSTPSQPGSLTVVNVSSSSVTLKWSAPLFPNGPIKGYIVSWTGDAGQISNTTVVKTTYTITGLTPWTEYRFNVKAYNSLKDPEMISEPIGGQTKTEVSAPGPVVSPTIYKISESSFNAKWVRPVITNGPITGYFLTVVNVETKENVTDYAFETNYAFTNLKPWTEYSVTIQAYNTILGVHKMDFFGPGVTESQRTSVGSPTAPQSLGVETVTNTSIEVTWEKPEVPNGPISGYYLQIVNQTEKTLVVNDTTFTFNNLLPWSNYSLSVVAFNDDGKTQRRSPEARVEERTSASAPEYATSVLSAGSTQKDSAALLFPLHLFSQSNGDIVEYILLVAAAKSKSNTQDQGYETLNETSFPNWNDAKNSDSWYRSSHKNWDIDTDTSICSMEGATNRKCVIGSDKTCSDKTDYCDAPLSPNTQYWAKIRAYTDAGWTETFPVTFTTAGTGILKPTLGLAVFVVMQAIGLLGR